MSDTDTPDADDIALTFPAGNLVRLVAMLAYIEETHDEQLVRGWAGKQLEDIQEQTRIQLGDVAAYQDDIEAIADGELSDMPEQVQGSV